jgi:putative transposase
MDNKKIDLDNFDFNQFRSEAIEQLKSGQSLTGKGGILTPLIIEILEAALEGEMDSHLSDCKLDNTILDGDKKSSLSSNFNQFDLNNLITQLLS